MAINDHLVTRSAELLSVQISMAAVAVLAVALRLISRFLVLKNPGWDDYIIALGTASTTSRLSVVLSLTSIQLLGLTTTVLTLAGLPYGAARHMADIVSMKDLECILKLSYISCITAPLAMVCVKDSLLLLYLRISPCVRFRRWVNCFLALFTIDAIIWSLVAAFQCSPINRAWTWSESGHCRNREFLYKAQGLWNLVENVVIIILPIPTIMRLQMQKRRRLLLSAVFAVGLVPCVAVVARLIPTTSPKVFQSDLTWWLITMQNWTAVEYGSGMICASLILLKPLIKIVFPSILGRSTLELRDRAAAPCPKQAKRAQCPKVACHQMNQQGCVTVPKKIGHALPEKALRIVTDQSRPLWYLDGLQSPDLEASYDNDTFSLASSQSPIDHNPCSIPSYGRRPLEINL